MHLLGQILHKLRINYFFQSQSPARNEGANVLPLQQTASRTVISVLIVILGTRRVEKKIQFERLYNWPNVEVNLHRRSL
jgi:hypothetical protein